MVHRGRSRNSCDLPRWCLIAIDLGLPSGVGALVVGLHPVITAVAGGAMLGEHLNFRQWGGVILGFTGVVLVVVNRLTDDTLNLPAAVIAVSLATLGTSIGTLIQRQRCAATPLLWGSAIQYASSAIAPSFLPGCRVRPSCCSLRARSGRWRRLRARLLLCSPCCAPPASSRSERPEFVFLVPALSAIEAAVLLDEQLNVTTVAGFATAIVGVALWLHDPERLGDCCEGCSDN